MCRNQHEGPSKVFASNFHRPLKHILNSVNQLDLPLVPSDLRIHLTVLEVILVQLLKTLRVSNVTKSTSKTSRSAISRRFASFQKNESKDALKMAEESFTVNSSKPLACSDQFLGTLVGYPRYKKGFVTYKCSHEEWNKSISIIIWDISRDINIIKNWENINISIFLLANESSRYANRPFINTVPPYPSVGKAIRRILRYISTPYVLLSPWLHSLNKNTNFNRMIYVAEKTKVLAVSGSFRSEEDGRWRNGCQVFHETEGHLIFKRSYTASLYECLLCHFSEGPVLLRTKWLIESNWARNHIRTDFLMPSLFFYLNEAAASYEHPVLVCPDVMFNYNSLAIPWNIQSLKSTSVKTVRLLQNLWKDVAKKKHLTKISLASGIKLRYPCHYLDLKLLYSYNFNFSNTKLEAKSGLRMCQEYELEYILSQIDKACEKLKLNCVLESQISQGKN